MSSSIEKQLESLGVQIELAKHQGNTVLAKELISQYNTLIDSLQTEDVDILTISGNMVEIPIESSNSFNAMKQKHIGITNILNGIVSNTAKGKYSAADKQFFVDFLTDTIRRLEDIDADIAAKEKQARKKMYSSIDSRL